MGLADLLLGQQNPVSQYVGQNRNTIRGAFAGFGQGRNFSDGLGQAALGANQGAGEDDAFALTQAAEAKRQEQLMATISEMRKYNPQIASIVETGGMDPTAGWNQIMQGMQGAAPTDDMREFEFAQQNPEFAQFLNPTEAPKPTADIQEYNYALEQGYQGTFTDYQMEMKKAGATNIDFNANQGTAAAYADRMLAADQVLSDPALTTAMTDLIEQGKANVPVAGNFLVSEEYQMAEQAQRDFVNAILRRESGAVISPSEFENAKKQYFPQPGDNPIVIEQKARNRRTAIEGVARAAGPNYGAQQQPGGVVDYTTYFGAQ